MFISPIDPECTHCFCFQGTPLNHIKKYKSRTRSHSITKLNQFNIVTKKYGENMKSRIFIMQFIRNSNFIGCNRQSVSLLRWFLKTIRVEYYYNHLIYKYIFILKWLVWKKLSNKLGDRGLMVHLFRSISAVRVLKESRDLLAVIIDDWVIKIYINNDLAFSI